MHGETPALNDLDTFVSDSKPADSLGWLGKEPDALREARLAGFTERIQNRGEEIGSEADCRESFSCRARRAIVARSWALSGLSPNAG